MLTSETRGEMPTPNPNKCNSMLTSGNRGIYPCLYIDEESVPCAKFESYFFRHDTSVSDIVKIGLSLQNPKNFRTWEPFIISNARFFHQY